MKMKLFFNIFFLVICLGVIPAFGDIRQMSEGNVSKLGLESGVAAVSSGSLNVRFIDAAREKNIELAIQLAQQGADLNTAYTNAKEPNYEGFTALMFFVQFMMPDAVKRLLQVQGNINIDAQDARGYTALMYAAERGEFESAEALVKKGADHSLKNNDGLTALGLVEKNLDPADNRKIAELLRAIPARPKDASVAARGKNIDLVMQLAQRGADLNAGYSNTQEPTYEGYTALMFFVRFMMPDAVKRLLQAQSNLNINAQDARGYTALMHAAERGEFESAEALVKKGADDSLKNNDGLTAITIAEKNPDNADSRKIAQLLRAAVADRERIVSISGWYGTDASHIDVSAALDAVYKKFGSILVPGGYMNNLFGDPAPGDRKRCEISFVDGQGTTGHLVSEEYNEIAYPSKVDNIAEVSKLLTDAHKAAIKAKDADGETPLMNAIQADDLAVVRGLLAVGADLSPKNNAGATALHIAIISDKSEIARDLIDRKADVNVVAEGIFNMAPLHIAVVKNNLEVVMRLLSSGAQVNAMAAGNTMPLHLAVEIKSAKMISLLIEKGAKIDQKNEQGLSPYDIAVATGDQKIINLFPKVAKDIRVTAAWYGLDGNPLSADGNPTSDGKPTNLDVVTKMQGILARFGDFIAVPRDMNRFFGRDPLPGKKKNFAVQIVIDGKVYDLRAPEGRDFAYPINIKDPRAQKALKELKAQ